MCPSIIVCSFTKRHKGVQLCSGFFKPILMVLHYFKLNKVCKFLRLYTCLPVFFHFIMLWKWFFLNDMLKIFYNVFPTENVKMTSVAFTNDFEYNILYGLLLCNILWLFTNEFSLFCETCFPIPNICKNYLYLSFLSLSRVWRCLPVFELRGYFCDVMC